MSEQKTKTLKIHALYQGDNKVPHIHLAGQWLAKLGFTINDHVSITIREGLLIIEPLEAAAQQVQEKVQELQSIKTQLKKLA